MVSNTKNESSKEEPVPSSNIEGPSLGNVEKSIALGAFHTIERVLLFIVVLLTLGGVAFEIHTIFLAKTITLADILLMFLYLEIVGMVAVYYADHRSAFVYPIFIAITALSRLIILQGKEMAPENILYEAVAILILAVAGTVLVRMQRS